MHERCNAKPKTRCPTSMKILLAVLALAAPTWAFTPSPVTDAVAKVGLKFSDFELTDNSCKASEGRLKEFEEDLVFVEARLANGIQLAGEEVSKDVIALEKEVEKDVVAIEKEVVKDVVAIEKEVVKDAVAIEKEIAKDVEYEVNAVEKALGFKK